MLSLSAVLSESAHALLIAMYLARVSPYRETHIERPYRDHIVLPVGSSDCSTPQMRNGNNAHKMDERQVRHGIQNC